MKNKISVIIIAFLLLINVSRAYSAAAVMYAANGGAETGRASGKTVINYSSFKQISKHMYDICAKVYVNIQNEMHYFSSPADKSSAINKRCKIMCFSARPIEYAFSGSSFARLGAKSSYLHVADINGVFSGFKAICVFVTAMFMLFLNALYKGSVPNLTITVFNNQKARRF